MAAPRRPYDDDRPRPRRPDAAAPLAEALVWHSAWAGAVVAVTVLLAIGFRGLPASVVLALLAGALPGAAAWLLKLKDRPRRRQFLLAAWTAASTVAMILTGGVAGPLGVWCLAPVGAAAMLGRRDELAQAAALAVVSAGVAGLAQFSGAAVGAPGGLLAQWLALAAVTTTAGSLGGALLLARRRQAASLTKMGRSQSDLSIILQSQPHLLLTVSPTGAVTAAYGETPEGVDRMALFQGGLVVVARPEDRPALHDALRRAAMAERVTLGFAPASALENWIVCDLSLGKDGRLIAALRDASHDRAREASLDQARLDAEALNAGKSRFLANMSHELRTPLNAIMGFSDIMRNRMFGALPGKYVEYADLIHESGRHLLDLINDVLDMSKIEAQRYELAREVLDARDPVSAALRILRLQADDAGVALRGVLPQAPLEVDADPRALKQIVINLVSNALKFTPRGGQVTVSLTTAGEAMELTVADTGVGIAAEDLERLGRPYEQAGGADQKAKGTGLGLSLVRAFAQLHGGEMSIESRLGEGTAVTVRLPVLVAQSEEPPSPEPSGGAKIIAFQPVR